MIGSLVHRNGSEKAIELDPHHLPTTIECRELRGGFLGWALRYAARIPKRSSVLRRYVRQGETLMYREE